MPSPSALEPPPASAVALVVEVLMLTDVDEDSVIDCRVNDGYVYGVSEDGLYEYGV